MFILLIASTALSFSNSIVGMTPKPRILATTDGEIVTNARWYGFYFMPTSGITRRSFTAASGSIGPAGNAG